MTTVVVLAILTVGIFLFGGEIIDDKVNLPRHTTSYVPQHGFDKSGHHRFTHSYSIWLQPSEEVKFNILKDEIIRLANIYNGTNHGPHATLYGPIYTINESSVIDTAKRLAASIVPFDLRFKSLDCRSLNVTKRWRSTMTIRYEENDAFTSAAKKAMVAYEGSSEQKPHSTLLYNFDGSACNSSSTLVEVVESLEMRMKGKSSDFRWTAQTLAVYYTPLRDHWKSADDMIEVVGQWQSIATFALTGSLQ